MIRVNDVTVVPRGGGVAKAAATKAPAAPKQSAKLDKNDVADGTTAARALESLVSGAIAMSASDVHIEPHGKEVQLRYRVDGLLRPGRDVPHSSLPALIARAKILANLDMFEARVPQDGRFDIAEKGTHFSVQVSCMPVADGEKMVLHIIDQSAVPHDLEKLGYWGHSLHALQDAVAENRGLVVVSGPAGSGKTATLYGLLHLAADPSRNIATVEDTIEHRIPGINQTPVNTRAGMTFASSVRAVLRQDPNVLMIGELAEPETAGMALQAALAGRLVLVGMHTRNVAAALAHLVAMNVEPYLLASATRAVTNQRLVRRLCTSCRESYKPTTEQFASACQACGLDPKGVTSHLVELEKSAVEAFGAFASPAAGVKGVRMWQAHPQGCAACGGTGYKGRIALSEVLGMSPAVQKLVFSGASPTTLYSQAIAEGMIPLPMDGFVKASLGITSVEEVLRVVAE